MNCRTPANNPLGELTAFVLTNNTAPNGLTNRTGYQKTLIAKLYLIGDQALVRENYLFTSESVAEGHPDKVCDRISDEIVDLFFREGAKAGVDPYQTRVACETLATTNRVVIAGEVRGAAIGSGRDRGGGARRDQEYRL